MPKLWFDVLFGTLFDGLTLGESPGDGPQMTTNRSLLLIWPLQCDFPEGLVESFSSAETAFTNIFFGH